ncbi:MAG: hypothetical protein LBP62_02915 [Clostridiales bacterium]|jgi:hypothetical protein|nr:hypothetical protein [Clostridiales bacterium]
MGRREKNLAVNIMQHLSCRQEDESLNVPIAVSREAIESYGVSFDIPNDDLVISAIRHLIYIINPWNRLDICTVLAEQCGFTKAEAKRYFNEIYL